jgi:hypothetical protein
MSFGAVLAGSNQSLDSSLNTIYEGFMLLRDDTGVARSCATTMKLSPHEGASKNINNYNRVTAYSVGDGVDISQAQQLADTTTTYTPGEVAVQVVLAGSTMRRVADPALESRTGRILNNAYDLKEDQDGCAQFSSFTPIMGVANNVLGVGEYFGAMTRLMIGNNRATPEPPPEPYYIVDHPVKLQVLAGRLMGISSTASGGAAYTPATVANNLTVGASGTSTMAQEMFKRGLNALGTFYGATVKRDANIAVDASDDCSGAAFSKEGFIYISEVEPRLDADTSDKSMRGAVELNVWGSYVWGLYRAGAYGVEILGDATLPAAS